MNSLAISRQMLILILVAFLPSLSLSGEADEALVNDQTAAQPEGRLYTVELSHDDIRFKNTVYASFENEESGKGLYRVVCRSSEKEDAEKRCLSLLAEEKFYTKISLAAGKSNFEQFRAMQCYEGHKFLSNFFSYFYSSYSVDLENFLEFFTQHQKSDKDISSSEGIDSANKESTESVEEPSKSPQNDEIISTSSIGQTLEEYEGIIQGTAAFAAFTGVGIATWGILGSDGIMDRIHDLFETNVKDAPGGFYNFGNTCFANASTVLMLESPYMDVMLSGNLEKGKLPTLPNEGDDQFNSRKKLQTDVKNLRTRRLTTSEITNEFVKPSEYSDLQKIYFEALTGASNSIDLTDKIGGLDGAILMKDQGDAADFIFKVHEYLQHPEIHWSRKVSFRNPGNTVQYFNQVDNGIVSLNLPDTKDEKTFSEIFAENTRPQEMEGENKIKAEDGNLYDSTATYGFNTLPDSVILRLNRFKLDDYGRKWKVSSPVNIEDTVTIKNFDESEHSDYFLKSVVIHRGSVKWGHYYAYVYVNDHKWIKYNDSSTSEVSYQNVADDVLKNGYIFLYIKK